MPEIKEIEKLPEGWKKVRLGEIVIENIKSSFKVEDATNSGEYPFFTSGEFILTHNEFLVEHENLFISTGGTAYIKYYQGKASYSADTYSVKTKEHTRLIFYILNKASNHITYKYFIGSGLEHLQKEYLKENFEFIIPNDWVEQSKIAEILETIDNAIEKTDKLIEKYKRIKQGLMQDLLTKGIDENGNIRNEKTHKFKNSPLGRIPEEWEIVKLGEICDIKGGKRLPKGEDLIDEGHPYIRLTDIVNFKIKFDNVKYIPNNIRKKLQKYIVFEGDVIISIVGTIGLVALIPKELNNANLTENAARLTNLKDLKSSYLVNLLSSSIIQKQINKMIGIVAQPKLALFRLANIILIKPSLSEQQKISEILSQIDNVIEKEEKYKEKLQRIKQGLMEDLLTGKVRVNNLIEEIPR